MLFCALFYQKKIYSIAQFICRGIFRIFHITYNIIGEFPNKGPYILMHNHSSFLDMFFLPIVIKGKFTGVVAAKNFKIPILGALLKALKAIPIHRANSENAHKGIRKAEKMLKEGYHIAIFPEGTRTTTGELGEFKKGGFHMAVNTQHNILPIIVKGLYTIKPKTRWTLKKGQATMIIKKPINVKNKSVNELLTQTRQIYLNEDLK